MKKTSTINIQIGNLKLNILKTYGNPSYEDWQKKTETASYE